MPPPNSTPPVATLLPPEGLDAATAARRLRDDGPNELGLSLRRTWLDVAREVVSEPMFLLLLGAGAIYLAMGDPHEAMVLLGFVVIIMAVTVVQERRTDQALDALRELSSPRARVLRDGQATRIPGREVVRDDVLILSEGDRIPADGVLLQAHEFAADESTLTGESVPVTKAAPMARVFAGTMVVSGQAVMQVDATGIHTELGRIGKSLQTLALQASPLREEVARLTRKIVMVGLALCVVMVALYWVRRGGGLHAWLAGITLAMSLLPQEFPVIMIIFLAFGARRMAAQQVLTRRLNAIETLGQATVLCVDKTGTLTENRMAVAALCVGSERLDTRDLPAGALPKSFHELLEYAVLASEIDPHDPMERAVHHLAHLHLAHTDRLHPQWDLAREYELSADLLAMSHLWRDGSDTHDVVATKGAPEAVAQLCHLTPEQQLMVSTQARQLAGRGLRVLGIAKARHQTTSDWPGCQHDFNFEWLGLVGLADPLRAEVPEALARCRRAGIRVVMITGDHPSTAQAIARQAGIDSDTALTGDDLAGLNSAALMERSAKVHVFARFRPEQKLALVEALKARGEVVAMTGDGVNDAPALKSAHIGIAMGQRGTDVAREAASLVLLKDDFSSIVTAVAMGRRIFANLRQAMVYAVAVHMPILGLALLPVVLGLPVVLAPLHIAFLELIIAPACSIVFEAEEGSPDLMTRPPRPVREPLLSAANLRQGLLQGLLVTAASVGLYAGVLAQGVAPAEARTLAFALMVATNTALILPSRCAHGGWRSLWKDLPAVSLWVVSGTLLALVLITTVPAWTPFFGFVPLGGLEWLALACASLGLMGLLQVLKAAAGKAAAGP